MMFCGIENDWYGFRTHNRISLTFYVAFVSPSSSMVRGLCIQWFWDSTSTVNQEATISADRNSRFCVFNCITFCLSVTLFLASIQSLSVRNRHDHGSSYLTFWLGIIVAQPRVILFFVNRGSLEYFKRILILQSF